ncbi:MAG: hypothetical protein LBE25_01175 [Arthrobacter sp.]|nr:hypothetical protein [Arthrobacter sp.]
MSPTSKPRKPRRSDAPVKGGAAGRGAAGAGRRPGSEAAADAAPARVERPWTVMITSLIMALEAVIVLWGALNFVFTLRAPGPLNVGGRLFLVVLMVGAAAFAASVAAKHLAGRAWTRAAVVVWQLFQVILSGQFLGGGAPVLGVVLLVPAAVALVLVFAPATRRFLEADDQPRR